VSAHAKKLARRAHAGVIPHLPTLQV